MHRFTLVLLFCLAAGTAFGQWVVRPTGSTENLYGIAARGASGATVVGMNATILYSEDDGFDWGPQQGEAGVDYYAVSFADHDIGVIAGTAGTILFTSNAGDPWETKETGWMHPYYAAHQLSPLVGAVAGINSVFQPIVGVTSDAWLNYQFYIFYPQQGDTMYEGTVRGIHFVTADIGFAAVAVWDGQGAICRTTDGGTTWETVHWNANALYAIDFVNADTGCAVGANGTIVHTWDGGANWNLPDSPTTQTLRGVSYGHSPGSFPPHVWAVGDGGTIIYSWMGGEAEWVLQQSPVGTTLNAVSFANADTGYIAGDNGAVLYTSNAGGAVPNNPPGEFLRVFPPDSTVSDSMGLLVWTQSIDPDTDAVTYIVRVHTDYDYWMSPDSTLELITPDTSLELEIPIPLNPLDEIFHFWWRVYATDDIDTVEAANGEGMFMLDIILRAGEPSGLPPSSFSLSAYPNPFNPITTLHLSLPVSSEAVLKVFDVTGRLAREIRLGRLESGSHDVAFDGSDLPSGIYLAALETPQVRLTQKLVLMK